MSTRNWKKWGTIGLFWFLLTATASGIWWLTQPNGSKSGWFKGKGAGLWVSTEDAFPSVPLPPGSFQHEKGTRYDPQRYFASYQPVFKWCRLHAEEPAATCIVLREFRLVGKADTFLLILNPETLRTRICRKPSQAEFQDSTPQALSETLYGKLLNLPPAAETGMENAGLVHARAAEAVPPVLSVDLCPSLHPFSRDMFHRLVALGSRNHKPTPVVICVSGLWIRQHKADLLWLKEAEKKRELEITWVNHSYSHPYEEHVPWNHNFLLSTNVDFKREVFESEQIMIEEGLVPSVFFRFPGLISSQSLVNSLNRWGLIPLGSDAWLGKGQNPQPGSIILVHGNGNEPLGVRRLERLLGENLTEFSDLYAALGAA
ncbi:MAG: polysaccharide deacetylase [Blastocatellia bacterium]|nr:polysaccharide deacetylase [Blastocatellia bacterium]